MPTLSDIAEKIVEALGLNHRTMETMETGGLWAARQLAAEKVAAIPPWELAGYFITFRDAPSSVERQHQSLIERLMRRVQEIAQRRPCAPHPFS